MAIIQLIFVRHGDAVISQAGMPRMLTPAGISQANEVARVLAGRTIAKVWSSSMVRAEQTAAVIGESLGLPVLLDDRLRERQDEDPAPGVTAADDDPADVLERFSSMVGEIIAACPEQTALIVTHGAITTRGLLTMCSNLDEDYVAAHPLGNGAIVEVNVDQAGDATCLSWGGQSLVRP